MNDEIKTLEAALVWLEIPERSVFELKTTDKFRKINGYTTRAMMKRIIALDGRENQEYIDYIFQCRQLLMKTTDNDERKVLEAIIRAG